MAESMPASPDATSYRIAEAENAHARGWLLTPTRGKRPFLKEWQKRAAPDLPTVKQWAQQGNVANRTGKGSGLTVIDDDTDDGSAAEKLGLPKTVTVLTGAGHKQYYFRAPDQPIGNSAGTLMEKVDVRAEGGAAVAVGSIHPDTKRMYDWAPGLSPDDVPLAELPPNIVEQLVKKSPNRARTAAWTPSESELKRLKGYARVAFQRHVEGLRVVSEGARNNILNRAAFVLGRFVACNLLDREEVHDALHAAARNVGLADPEIEATIKSGLDAGMLDPHDLKVLLRKERAESNKDASIPHRPRPDERGRPVIVVMGGKLPEIVDKAEKALLNDRGSQIYQRENLMVRMVRARDVQLHDGIKRPQGALILIMIEPAYMIERFTRAASFQKFDTRLNEYAEIDCTERIACTYLARKGFWKLPVLRAVIEAPTLRPDGSILQAPGYDAATQIFFDAGGIEFAPVLENPTIDDARAALRELRTLLSGFPFVEECDRSVAHAAILTSLIRRSVRTAPLFAFRAPKMGSGKSLLADCVALIATGRPVPAMPQGKDEDEDRKRMLALLLEGDACCCIDNIERPLSSSSLCSILTQVTWKDRILGRTGTATVPTCVTWLATGNNLVISGDLSTRSLVCDLDAKTEHPEEREFSINLYDYIPEQRAKLVPAALTVLRAYHLAGRPKQKIKVFGRFEGWSNWVRSALVWCGEADPCETRKRIEMIDPVRRLIQAVLMQWHELFGTGAKTAAEVIEASRDFPSANKTFHEVLCDALNVNDTKLNPLRLGNWLDKHERRPEGGLKIERAGERQGVCLWKVSRA
jgi:hypothetical protein